ncbi:MAG: DUF4252 domain-containing protein [Paludibacteraceae bacterium]
MKKNCILFITLILFGTVQAQDLNKIFNKYSSDDRFEYVSVNSILMKFASIFANGNADDSNILSKMRYIKVLKLTRDGKNQALYDSFQKEVKNVTLDQNFEKMISSRNTDNSATILTRTIKENNTDIIIVSDENNTLGLIWLRGKITKEELSKIESEEIDF